MSVKKTHIFKLFNRQNNRSKQRNTPEMELSDSLHGKQDKADCVPAQHTILCWKPSE